VALVRPVGYLANAASFRLYSIHFKAGNGAGGTSPPTDSTQRTLECTNLRNTLNAAPAGTNLVMGGDTNFYGSFETGYTRLTESQADNDGRLKDPYTMTGLWNNPSYAALHTQSPCNGAACVGSGGGMDDRFDMLLGSYSLNDGLGLDLVPGALPGGYGPYGNDGLHYNDSIDGGGFNGVVPLVVASSLRLASDHVPVIATLQLPAKLSAPSALDFGSAIIGGTAFQSLVVDDLPPPPAATLTYSLTAPAGFTAPAGTFNNPAAAAADPQPIGMSTASVGDKSGTLTINSNDLDTTSKNVLLSGRVLAHAVPSLDSTTTTIFGSVSFGEVEQNSITNARSGCSIAVIAFQARLSATPSTSPRSASICRRMPPHRTRAFVHAAGGHAHHRRHVHRDARRDGRSPGQPLAAEVRIVPVDEPLRSAGVDTLRVSLFGEVRSTGGVESAHRAPLRAARAESRPPLDALLVRPAAGRPGLAGHLRRQWPPRGPARGRHASRRPAPVGLARGARRRPLAARRALLRQLQDARHGSNGAFGGAAVKEAVSSPSAHPRLARDRGTVAARRARTRGIRAWAAGDSARNWCPRATYRKARSGFATCPRTGRGCSPRTGRRLGPRERAWLHVLFCAYSMADRRPGRRFHRLCRWVEHVTAQRRIAYREGVQRVSLSLRYLAHGLHWYHHGPCSPRESDGWVWCASRGAVM
jgi:hypothetical protein